MKDAIASAAQDWGVLVLLGLGVKMAPHEFWSGVLLAMAAAMVARKMSPERDQREVWLVLISAVVLAIFAAMLASYLRSPEHGTLPPDFPIQMAMAASGFFSRFVMGLALRMAGRVETKTDDITDRVVDRFLPPGDKEDDK